LQEDKRNQRYLDEATSLPRFDRLTELLAGAGGTINAGRAAEFLRDRKLPGGKFAGNGQRAALNAFIATHATVMDLTDGIFWAAAPPHQLGKFVAFDVNDFDRELPALTIAADETLASGEFEKAQAARKNLADGERALKSKDAATALTLADAAEGLNPGFYQNAALRGRALRALGRNDEAAKAFTAALAAHPAFLAERQQLEGWLKSGPEAH
jgi:tetratricopeptide (TPR) repeat protein